MKQKLLIISLLPLSFGVFAQSNVNAVKQRSLNRAQQDSVVNKATSTGGKNYVDPKLKDANKKDPTLDQYDCDSTCLAMGGNKNSTKTITENKTERCPSGFRGPKGNSFIVTATRTVTTKYSGNTVTSTSYSDWVPSANSISCIQEETRTLGCSGGMTGEKTESRTSYYNGSYTWGNWVLAENTCACPYGTYFDSNWGSCIHPPPPIPPQPPSGNCGPCGCGSYYITPTYEVVVIPNSYTWKGVLVSYGGTRTWTGQCWARIGSDNWGRCGSIGSYTRNDGYTTSWGC